jgi:putative membrane protein
MWSSEVWVLGVGAMHMLLFWGLIILAILALVKVVFGASNRGDNSPDPGTPLEILQARYARGEIDREEYLRKRDDI